MTDENQADDNTSGGNLDDAFDDKDTEREEVGAKPAKTPEPVQSQGEESEAEEAEEDAGTPTADESDEEGDGKSVPMHRFKAALKSAEEKHKAELDEIKKKLPQAEQQEEAGEPDIDQKLFAERTNISREVMKELKADYEDMENLFVTLAKQNPVLAHQMARSPNPAKYAYEKAKEHLEYEQFKKDKDSDEYKEFLKAKAEKAKAPVPESPQAKRNKTALSVPNINKAPSIASNSIPKERLETLDEMFEE